MRQRLIRPALLAAPAVLLAVSGAAQQDDTFHVPLSLALFEGDSQNTQILNPNGYIRWQQVVTDSVLRAHPIRWVAFRRDGSTATPGALPRNIEVSLRLGEKNPPVLPARTGPFGNDFEANFRAGTATELIARKSVNLPDWSQLPANAPADFDLAFPADAGVFFFYGGQVELVWEIQVWSAGGGSHAVDATTGTGAFQSTSTTVGPGCGAFGHRFTFDVGNWGSRSSMTIAATDAPPLSPVVFMLGDQNPAFPLPGYCASVHTNLLIATVMGFADAAGSVSLTVPQRRYRPSYAFLRFYTQCGGFDGTPLLSDGKETLLPFVPTPLWLNGPGFTIEHIFTTDPASSTGTGPLPGGVILALQDF